MARSMICIGYTASAAARCRVLSSNGVRKCWRSNAQWTGTRRAAATSGALEREIQGKPRGTKVSGSTHHAASRFIRELAANDFSPATSSSSSSSSPARSSSSIEHPRCAHAQGDDVTRQEDRTSSERPRYTSTKLLPAERTPLELARAGTSIINQCARTGDWTTALLLLEEMRKSKNVRCDRFLYNATINACAKSQQWRVACTLLDSMPAHNLTPDVISFNTCIHAVDGTAWAHALTLLDRMRDCAIPADSITHVAAISACERGGAWEHALELLHNIVLRNERTGPACTSSSTDDLSTNRARREAHSERIACNATIAALAKAGKWQRAWRLLSDMPCDADVISYNTTITALGAAGLWQQALALFRDMPVMPDVISCNAMISACTKEWRQALRVYSQMRNGLLLRPAAPGTFSTGAPSRDSEAGHEGRNQDPQGRLQDDSNEATNTQGHVIRIRPTVVTYGALITACEKGGAWQQAMTLLSDMTRERVRGNTITYNAAISACEKRRKWIHALALFDRMQRAGIIPDVITYSALISACRNGNAWQHALTLFASLDSARSCGVGERSDVPRSARLKPNLIAYNAALSACDTGAQWQHALRLLERMTADAGVDNPRHGRCDALCDGPRHACKHTEQVRADVVSFSSAIAACEKAGKWEHALGILRRMRTQDVAPNTITYNVVLSALSGARHVPWQMAEHVVEQMKADGVTPNAVTYSIVLKHHDPGASRYIKEALDATNLWAASASSAFVTKPYDAVMLLQILGHRAPEAFVRHVREWLLDPTVSALRDGNLESLRQFDLPNLGPLTREALDAVGLVGFNASDARQKTQVYGAAQTCDTVKARDILVHVKTTCIDRVVTYGLHSASTVLPSVYIDHDRSAHAERQALLQIDEVGLEGIVELYVTHRPCVSCIAGMVAFQKRAPNAVLKVEFDELDCD